MPKPSKALRAFVPQDSIVYTSLVSVSRSGMSRTIRVYVVPPTDKYPKPQILNITFFVAHALGERYTEEDRGLVVKGCGTDVGFETVYRLARALYPEAGGYSLKQTWI